MTPDKLNITTSDVSQLGKTGACFRLKDLNFKQ